MIFIAKSKLEYLDGLIIKRLRIYSRTLKDNVTLKSLVRKGCSGIC